MLRYPGHFKDGYCIAKVSDVHPGDDGLVRQVTVSYRKKNSRESPSVFRSKPLISERVALHRLHRLHLADEELQLGAGQAGVVVGGDQALRGHVDHEGHAGFVDQIGEHVEEII